MKKTLVPVLLLTLLFTSIPAMAWNHYSGGPGWRGGPPARYYGGGGYHRRGPGIGPVVGGLIVGGLIAGTIAAAVNSQPVQVVQQPVYVQPQPVVVQQPAMRMCVEDRRVSGEYQYDASGNAVWVQFAHPQVRSYQVPCP